MPRTSLLAGIAALALVSACSAKPEPAQNMAADAQVSESVTGSANTQSDPAQPVGSAPAPHADQSSDATDSGSVEDASADNSDATTAAPTPERLTTASAAADVVKRYYAAIDRGDFRAAYRLWGDGGKASHQSLSAFEKGFAATKSTSVTIGQLGYVEGAAGSAYTEIPVTVDATLKDGAHQHFTGTYTMRRVNDVDGSTTAQRRWHIESADLKPA